MSSPQVLDRWTIDLLAREPRRRQTFRDDGQGSAIIGRHRTAGDELLRERQRVALDIGV
jgi:hypothetical protein